jgi:hypothetical protein
MNAVKRYDPPLLLRIPLPSEIPRSKGPDATSGYGGNLRIRCTDEEYNMIKEEAALLDLTTANFCRWVILHSASALRKHREEDSEDYKVEVKSGEGLRIRVRREPAESS